MGFRSVTIKISRNTQFDSNANEGRARFIRFSLKGFVAYVKMMKTRVLCLNVILFGLVLGVFVSIVEAQPVFNSTIYYHIIAKHSGKCLDVYNNFQDDETNVQQCACHGGKNQQFRLIQVKTGQFKIIARHSEKCLDVYRVSQENEANVQQYHCNHQKNQTFQFIPVKDGYFKIVAAHSGKCLDVYRVSHDNETNVQQCECHGRDNQLWKVIEVK